MLAHEAASFPLPEPMPDPEPQASHQDSYAIVRGMAIGENPVTMPLRWKFGDRDRSKHHTHVKFAILMTKPGVVSSFRCVQVEQCRELVHFMMR